MIMIPEIIVAKTTCASIELIMYTTRLTKMIVIKMVYETIHCHCKNLGIFTRQTDILCLSQ